MHQWFGAIAAFLLRGKAGSLLPPGKAALLLPPGAWLLGLAAFTTLSVETLFVEDNVMFLVARLTAYLTSALMGASVLAFAVLFGVGSGLMLRWLHGAARTGLVVRAIAESTWVLVAYMWLGVLLLALWPPAAVTLAEAAQADFLQARFEQNVAFRWVVHLRHVALGGALAFCVWRLARAVGWLNAVLAAGFGASLVAALMAALGALARSAPTI